MENAWGGCIRGTVRELQIIHDDVGIGCGGLRMEHMCSDQHVRGLAHKIPSECLQMGACLGPGKPHCYRTDGQRSAVELNRAPFIVFAALVVEPLDADIVRP